MIRTALLFLAAARIAHAQAPGELGGFKPEEFAKPDAVPVVTLLTPGTGELRPLRYRFAERTTYKVSVTIEGSVSVEMNGQSSPWQQAPVLRFVQLIAVLESDENAARLEAKLQEPEIRDTAGLDRAALERLQNELRPLAKVRHYYTITTRGVITETRFETDGEITPALRERLAEAEEVSFALPEQPVGVGARWRTLRQVKRQGLAVYNALTVELAKRDDASAALAIVLDQFIPAQRYVAPGQPPSMRTDAHGHGKGKGSSVLDLGAPAARGSMAIEGDLVMSLQANLPMESRTHTRLRLRTESEKVP